MFDKKFRDWPVDQIDVSPPSADDQDSDDTQLATFVCDVVRSKPYLAEIEGFYVGGRGRPAYDPTMMTALIVYAYCLGMHSSREIARACCEQLGFKALTGTKRRTSAR